MWKFDNQNTPITYLVWVLLWVNAIKDSYLWMDSPDCFFFKNDYIHWNHDINSMLRKEDWKHKILSTIADADNVVGNRNSRFVETLKQMSKEDFVKQIFVSSMPMSQVVWTDYDWVIKEVKEQVKKPIFNIPSRSMTDCWLEGYADLLFSLSKNMDLSWGNPKKENVAIIWNLFDRNEWDCIANVDELKRIIRGLWLNPVSVWLEWGNFDDLYNVKDAWTIISLPYWRKAAKKIAKTLKSDLLELDLPFGLDKTWEFINEIASHFWIEDKAEDFIKKELTEFNKIEIIRWVIPHTFVWKKIGFYWDPYLVNGIIDLSKTLWFELVNIFIHGEEKHFKNNKNIDLSKYENIEYGLSWGLNLDLDLLITNSHDALWWENPFKTMQFGFPSYDYHVYTYEPYFWYKWSLKFINRMANLINDN